MANDPSTGKIWSVLFLLALAALAVHLLLRVKGPRPVQEVASGLAFLASTYLAAFFFLTSTSGIARLLRLFGLGRDISSLLALPLGLAVAYKLYSAYEKWRLHR